MKNETQEGLSYVESSLNYLVDMDEKPYVYMYTPPSGVPSRTGWYAPQTVSICNGRPILDQFSLDQNGFLLTHHETKVTNFYDEQEVKAVYYPELEQLVKQVTGAVKVV